MPLLDTAKAAEFFLSDGVILTGTSTGEATDIHDLTTLYNKINIPILIGSGVTLDNLKNYYTKANAIIIGSHFKTDGRWTSDLCGKRISSLMLKVQELRQI